MFVYFYDNNWDNRDVNFRCPYIIYNKVFCDQNFQRHTVENDAFQNFISDESVSVQKISSLYSHHHYDPMSGIKLESGTGFLGHVEHMARSPHVSAFVFDWDRTLQPYESMTTHSLKWLENKYDGEGFSRALAIYHAGGFERFQKIRHMFEWIFQNMQHQIRTKICPYAHKYTRTKICTYVQTYVRTYVGR